MIRSVAFIVTALVHFGGFAQSKFIRHYTTEQGLANNHVKSIDMDGNGYAWLATEFGFSRFDGARFINYNQNNFPAIYSNRFIGIYKNTEGVLYALNDAWQVFQVDANSELISRGDLKPFKNCIITSTGQFTEIVNRQPDALEKRILQQINVYTPVFVNEYILSDRSCYFTYRDEVRYLTASSEELIIQNKTVLDRSFVYGQRFYVFNEKNELEIYEKGRFYKSVKLSIDTAFTAGSDITVFPYITGNLLKYGNKLYKLNVTGDHVQAVFIMPVAERARYRLLDRIADDMQFVASAKDGFYQIQKQKFKTYVPEGQTWVKETYALINYRGRVVDNKWFLINSGVETEKSVNRVFYASLLQNDSVLWMYDENEIFRYNVNNPKDYTHFYSGDYRIDFFLSPFDNKLYFYTGKEVFLLEDGKKKQVLLFQGTNEKDAHVINQFYSGSEWLVADNVNSSLALYNTNTGKVRYFPEFTHAVIRSIAYDKDLDCFWISTYGKGLFILDRRCRPVAIKDVSGNLSAAHYVLGDGLGYYWVPTNNGIYRMSQASVKNFIAGNTHVPEFNYYGEQDGLINNEFNGGYIHSGIRLPGGNLAFASMAGVVEINPHDFKDIKPYRIFIDNIEVDGINKGNDSKIEIKDNFISLTVSVSSPVFGNPKINFEYNIPELGTHWQPMSSDNQIRLSGLQAGNYTLRFRKQDEENPKLYTMLELKVTGPWYQSIPALIIYGLLTGFSLFSIVLIRANAQKKKALKEYQIAVSELKALRSQINPHHFSNALGSIQKYIYQNDMEKAGEYLANFSQLMRLSLDNSESDYITLTDEIAYLELYIELENRSMKTPFKYHFDTHDVYDTDAILVPSMLVQPFVENAIRHGLSPQTVKNPELGITFKYRDKVLQCIITDNGAGIEPIQKMNEKISGFKISSNRLNLFGKLLNIPVSITQLPAERGTSIAITMPYKTNQIIEKKTSIPYSYHR